MTAWKGIVGLPFTPPGFAGYCRGLTMQTWRPTFIVVHNTQVPTLAEWHTEPGERRMQGLASYYRDEQKWSGGPHLFVADDFIWAFTPLQLPGVHSPSWNQVSWGVEIVGDYDTEPFSDASKENVLNALATLHRLAGWDSPRIRLHKEDPATMHTFCPGKNIDKVELEAGIQTLLDLTK